MSTPDTPEPLEATFTGQATTTTTHTSAPGPYVADIRLGLLFNAERTTVTVTSFPPIVTPDFDTPYGRNHTTITKKGGGVGTYAAGQGSIPLDLHFDQSLDLPFFEEDSDLSLVLSTDPPGAPADVDGNVTLAGSGTFKKGFLKGTTGTITIVGVISPVP